MAHDQSKTSKTEQDAGEAPSLSTAREPQSKSASSKAADTNPTNSKKGRKDGARTTVAGARETFGMASASGAAGTSSTKDKLPPATDSLPPKLSKDPTPPPPASPADPGPVPFSLASLGEARSPLSFPHHQSQKRLPPSHRALRIRFPALTFRPHRHLHRSLPRPRCHRLRRSRPAACPHRLALRCRPPHLNPVLR